jgi:crotonobetainyl-CoA:carnitine CoA-transferase CaiB-like acyl-CoA transferase
VRDGWVFLAAPTEREWTDLVKSLGATHLATDERFATPERRRDNDAELVSTLGELLTPHRAADLEATLTAEGVGCAVVSEAGHSAFTSTDGVLFATGLTVDVDHPLFGHIRRHSPPVAFSETPGRVAPSCLRGEHNRDILLGIGYSACQVDDLERSGVVFPADSRPDADRARSGSATA